MVFDLIISLNKHTMSKSNINLIFEEQDGKVWVNAKELFLRLGQYKSNFPRWCKRHFIKEEEYRENIDYVYKEAFYNKRKLVHSWLLSFDLSLNLCKLDELDSGGDNSMLEKIIHLKRDEVYHEEHASNMEQEVHVEQWESNDTSIKDEFPNHTQGADPIEEELQTPKPSEWKPNYGMHPKPYNWKYMWLLPVGILIFFAIAYWIFG